MKKLNLRGTRLISGLLSFVLLFTMITGCNQEEEMPAPQLAPEENIAQVLENFDQEIDDFGDDQNARFKRRVPTFITLLAALKYTGLFKTVVKNQLTIFAPDDRAFAEIGLNFFNIRTIDKEVLTNILLYHVLPGKKFARDLSDCYEETLNEDHLNILINGGVKVKGEGNDEPSKVLKANLRALNGVIHIVEDVLIPPTNTIADIAGAAAPFSTLVSVVSNYPDLLAAIQDPNSNFTVFAPTNAAFDKIASVLPLLTADQIKTVLLHHIVPARAFSCDLSEGLEIPTQLSGNPITFQNGELVASSGIPVSLATDFLDIQANNGVIHGINEVLLPKEIVEAL